MSTPTNEERAERAALVIQAHDAGVKACEEGRMAVPALDPAFMALVDAVGLMAPTPRDVLDLLNAWTQAWHRTNVARAVTP